MSFDIFQNIRSRTVDNSYIQEKLDSLLKLFKERDGNISMAQEVAQEEERQHGGQPAPPVNEIIPAFSGDFDTSSVMDQLNYLLNHTVRTQYTSRPINDEDTLTGLHQRVERQTDMQVRVAEGDHVSTMSLEALRKRTKELKAKLDKWWTFADIVPNWNEQINKALQGELSQSTVDRNAQLILQNSAKCILGEGWGGEGWGNSHCKDCSWLGTSGLDTFIGNDSQTGNLKFRAKGYNTYKEKFEYHWNKYHYDVGNKYHKP